MWEPVAFARTPACGALLSERDTGDLISLRCVLRRPDGQPRRTIVTWLILPVVICLSQRLSHACLSISNYKAKLRMAHYISYRLFDSTLLHG
jgi:hypothetical protein